MLHKIATLIILLLHMTSSFCGNQVNSWEEVRENGEGTLEVFYSENRPFIFESRDGHLTGIEYDLMNDFVDYIWETHQKKITIQWQYISTFEDLYDSLRYSSRPSMGVASLSNTAARKNQINLSDSYLPDIEIIVSSNNFRSATNLNDFSDILMNAQVLSVHQSTFERNILDLKENYYPKIEINNVASVEVLIDSVASTDNLWGYVSLPNYLSSYRNDKRVVRQRFFMVENDGLSIGGTLVSDWHLPFNEYLKSARFNNYLDKLINTYLGPTFNKVVWSISESATDTLNSSSNKEVGMLTLEKELQTLQLKQNALEIENKNLIITFAVFAGFFLIFMLFVLFLMMRLKSRTNKQLSEKNERIKRQALDLKESYENLKTLSSIGREISASLSVEKINERIFASLNGFMEVGVFAIGLYNKVDDTLDFNGVMERGKKLDNFQYELTDESRLASLCFNKKQEIIIQCLREEYQLHLPKVPETKLGDQAESIIYMPLCQGEKPMGVLTVQSFKQNAFSDYQVDMVRNIANYSFAALDNASSYELITNQAEVLEKANQEIRENNQFIEQQNEELVTLNREKNELIGIVAHDLKNPLTSALSVTTMFRTEDDLSEDHREYLYLIRKSLNRMNHLIQKILEIKALEARSLEPELEEVSLRYILEEAVDELAVQAKQKDIEMTLKLLPTKVLIDPNYSLEIFENLLSNAIKFSDPGTNVHVRMIEKSGQSFVEIIDQGPGLTEADKGKLFRKFQKLSAKPTAGETSTGLGLSIVKKYVESMGGDIWCESKHGEGATFVVSFDMAG